MLKHGGIGSSGQCVTFPKEINEPCKILQKLPTVINIIWILKQGRKDKSNEFWVRRLFGSNYTIQRTQALKSVEKEATCYQ